LFLAILAFAPKAQASSPLVKAEWVSDRVDKPGIIFLNLRSFSAYRTSYVPSVVYTNYGRDDWLVQHKIFGNKDAKVHDGSLAE